MSEDFVSTELPANKDFLEAPYRQICNMRVMAAAVIGYATSIYWAKKSTLQARCDKSIAR
jgi:hypothetical protein